MNRQAAMAVTIVFLSAFAPGPASADGGPPAYSVSSADEGVAYLGVQLEEETEYAEGGARVTGVVDASPASRAGIRLGDIIVRFGDKTVRGPVALTREIHARHPGERASITVVREGRRESLQVELEARRSIAAAIAPAPLYRLQQLAPKLERLEALEPPEVRLFGWGRPRLGVQLVETTAELRQHLGGDADAGVLISKVLVGTPADHAGLRVGDLLVAVDGDPISDAGGLRRALSERAGRSFTIRVIRERESIELQVTLPADDEDRPTGPRASRAAPAPAPLPRPVGAAPAAPARPSPPVGI